MEYALTQASLKTFLQMLLPGENRIVFTAGETPHSLRVYFADAGDMQRVRAEMRNLGISAAMQPQGEAFCDFLLPLCHYRQAALAQAVQTYGHSARGAA